MRSIMRITQEFLVKYGQVFLVLIAFALMVISSYIFISNTERDHLRRYANNAISYTEVNIKSDLLEPETLLGSISETIRDMILNGLSEKDVHEYLTFITDFLHSGVNERMIGTTGFFGLFPVYDDVFLTGNRDWIAPYDYDPASRLWYSAAVYAAGDIGITQPYVNIFTNEISITFSRLLQDGEGKPLAVIGLDVLIDRIREHVVSTQFVKDGYGFLLSQNLTIIAHPEPSMIGMPIGEVVSGISKFTEEIRLKGVLSEITTTDYRGTESIVFVHRLENGWYMGVVTPGNYYFHSTRDLAAILSVLGAFFAALLIWILMRISIEKAKADERTQIMINATPFAVNFWNKDFNVIDCNQKAIEMFGLPGKQEYIQRFKELVPEYQPDGSWSNDIIAEYTSNVMNKGFARLEWTQQKPNGEPVPCEVTLNRVKYKDEYIIVGYTRDMREQNKMLKEIAQRTQLLNTVNSAATLLLSSKSADSFETLILKSFELLGTCLNIDRVQIWCNETIENETCFVLRYQWLSRYGRECRPVPAGLHFPNTLKDEWNKLFLQGEFINAPVSQLSQEARNFFGYYELKSIVIIPMFLDDYFWGLFSISDCRLEHTFSNDEISILTSAGLMISSAINRNIQILETRDAEERTQIMIDAAPLCAIFWDKNLKLIDCNQEAVKMFDLSNKQEFIDKFNFLSPEYQPDGMLSSEKGSLLVRKALDEGYSRFEWMHQKSDGESIPADIICIRVRHKDEYTVTEYIRDLREQKAMISEMRKAEVAEESSKAKSNFLARMSHEIRTPMNAILGIAEIQLQNESLAQSSKDAMERIYSSGDLLLGIINDILDLSKIEAGKLELLLDQYDIASLIHDTVQLNIMRYESKPVEFSLHVDENLPVLLVGDELRIKQILNNVLSNAFKYTEEGTVNLTVSVEQIDGDENSNIALTFLISDSGQGMTPEQVEKLGSEYARFNMEANRKTQGTGLGMNITMSLIQLMNGNISIQSTPGLGSSFKIQLPQQFTTVGTIGKELADNLMLLNFNNVSKIRTVQLKREFMPYGRVLVVDDVETNLYVARGLLAPYGLSMDTALSGFDAIEKIREGSHYDIIFMDHMMPRMDGIETTKIIREMGYTHPIVALTANALAGQAEMFIKSGFDDFISKPIDSRQLNSILNKLIRDKQSSKIIEEARGQKNNLYTAEQSGSVNSQLAEVFIRDAKKASAILEAVCVNKCRRNDDLALFIVNIHAMKSALANIGESDLSSLAAKLEQAGRDQDKELIFSELPSFIEQLSGVIHKFEGIVNSAESAQEAEGNSPYLKEKLLAIQGACAAYNKKAAREALTELKQKTWIPAARELLSAIAEYLLHSEFDEIAKAIDDYIKNF
ncbi:MAG: ATP-binding protein [Treponema sp.]|nr:ATP-binding protein [Treponema sp.]